MQVGHWDGLKRWSSFFIKKKWNCICDLNSSFQLLTPDGDWGKHWIIFCTEKLKRTIFESSKPRTWHSSSMNQKLASNKSNPPHLIVKIWNLSLKDKYFKQQRDDYICSKIYQWSIILMYFLTIFLYILWLNESHKKMQWGCAFRRTLSTITKS